MASNSWSEWLGEENSEKRKATNHHEREDLQAQKQPCLTDEWTAFVSKARKLSKKKPKKMQKARKQEENQERLRTEEDIKEWHRPHCKRNDSRKDCEEFNKAAINPPSGACETLDLAQIRLHHKIPGSGEKCR